MQLGLSWAIVIVSILAAACSAGMITTFHLLRRARRLRRYMITHGINGDAREIITGDVEDETLRLIKQSILTVALWTLPIQAVIDRPDSWHGWGLLLMRNGGVLIVHLMMTATSLRRDFRRKRWITRNPEIPTELAQGKEPTETAPQ